MLEMQLVSKLPIAIAIELSTLKLAKESKAADWVIMNQRAAVGSRYNWIL